MSKQLITANTVRQAAEKKRNQIEVVIKESIITPEARRVAEELNIKIVEQAAAISTNCKPPVISSPVSVTPDTQIATIREAILAKLPANSKIDEALVDQLVQKALSEHAQSTNTIPEPSCPTAAPCIRVVKGTDIHFSIFDGADEAKQIGIADVIGTQDGSSMAAGFMQWDNAFFPWTLTYDEVDVVLEGELHIRHDGKTHIGKAGDILFIPKGSAIEFGTPSSVRFVYVAWPANWQG